MAQLRPEVALGAYRARRYPLRTEGAREGIDVVVEFDEKSLAVPICAFWG